MDNVNLEFTSDALDEVAEMALQRKTGARYDAEYTVLCESSVDFRALRSIVEKVLLLPKFEVPGTDIDNVRITRGCVRAESPYEFTRRPEVMEEEEGEQKAVAANVA